MAIVLEVGQPQSSNLTLNQPLHDCRSRARWLLYYKANM